MSRMVSFWLLVAGIVILAIIFFRVMASFLLPLFLAAVLVVIFNPLHKWILNKLGNRPRIAAAATTAAIMSIVIVPIVVLLLLAAAESRQLFQGINTTTLISKIDQIRNRFGLSMPHAASIRSIEDHFQTLQTTFTENSVSAGSSFEYTKIELAGIERKARNLGIEMQLDWADEIIGDKEYNSNNIADSWQLFSASIQDARGSLNPTDGESIDVKQVGRAIEKIESKFDAFKTCLLGGKLRASLTEFANPTPDEIATYVDQVVATIRENLLSVGEATIEFIVKFIIGAVIMTLAVYFFLLDGRAMIEAVKSLTPLDSQHEEMLIQEFDRISRAVVVASLLSAVVQGILAGFGYYFAGLDSVFLLTLLTMLVALIPVVGTSLIWVPCCLYLYLFEGRMVAAILLGLFCLIVVSQIDNLIKPMVLHGQSKIHPLLALLSILGGISALGPIGILVGPMIVAFLQTLLKILRREMLEMDDNGQGTPQAAPDSGG